MTMTMMTMMMTRLVQWGAVNKVKIKPGTVSGVLAEVEGTCQLPQCWTLGRRIMTMSDRTADPCHSFFRYRMMTMMMMKMMMTTIMMMMMMTTMMMMMMMICSVACGGWLTNVSRQSVPGGGRGLESFSVMDESKSNIDRKIKGNI